MAKDYNRITKKKIFLSIGAILKYRHPFFEIFVISIANIFSILKAAAGGKLTLKTRK